MNKQPFVSVIIPTHNRKNFLITAVQSVLSQTYSFFELLIIDDGSDDGTEDIINTTFSDNRIIYMYQDHAGVSAARNNGIRHSTHNLIAFLDSDDCWDKNKLQKQITIMNDHPDILLSHTEERWIRHGLHLNQMNKHKKTGGFLFERCLELCCIGMSTVMCRKNMFEKIGSFRTDLPACEDYELFLRLCSRYPVIFIDDPLTIKHGGHSDQLSRQTGLDKYRIQSLCFLLDSKILTQDQILKTLEMLKRKSTIYGKGCIKHGKPEEGNYYLELPERYESKFSFAVQ